MSTRIAAAVVFTTAVAAIWLAGPAPAAADAGEPIEGTWTYEGGRVEVRATGDHKYTGTVVTATRFTYCLHPEGQEVWRLSGKGSAYRGTHIWYAGTSCRELPGGRATWRIIDTDPESFTLRFCTAPPGMGEPKVDASGEAVDPTECHTLRRTKPPAPGSGPGPGCSDDGGLCVRDPAFTDPQSEPRAGKCLSRSDIGRRFKLVTRRIRTRRGLRLRSVRYYLNGDLVARRHRRPFSAYVRTSRLRTGRNVLTAKAVLRRHGTKVRRTSRYAFVVC